MLAGGQEYTGDYGPEIGASELRRWHRRRLEVLAGAGADVLALETVPSLAETEALLLEVADLDIPVWLSLTCSGTSTRRGEPVAEAFAMAADVASVIAVGVNCTDPRDVATLVRLATGSSGKPAIAYPNSGETWDATVRRWSGSPDFDPLAVTDWVEAGTRLVGGCCRVGPDQIAALSAHLTTP
jgi:homocysteine S-methyltransferase